VLSTRVFQSVELDVTKKVSQNVKSLTGTGLTAKADSQKQLGASQIISGPS